MLSELEKAYLVSDRKTISAIEEALYEIDRPSLIKWKQERMKGQFPLFREAAKYAVIISGVVIMLGGIIAAGIKAIKAASKDRSREGRSSITILVSIFNYASLAAIAAYKIGTGNTVGWAANLTICAVLAANILSHLTILIKTVIDKKRGQSYYSDGTLKFSAMLAVVFNSVFLVLAIINPGLLGPVTLIGSVILSGIVIHGYSEFGQSEFFSNRLVFVYLWLILGIVIGSFAIGNKVKIALEDVQEMADSIGPEKNANRIFNKACAIDILKNRDRKIVVPELIRIAKGADKDAASAVVEFLEGIGWRPADIFENVTYLIIKNDPDSISKIGVPAVPPLASLLTDENISIRKRAAEALVKMGWKPATLQEKVGLHVSLEEWTDLEMIGKPAIPYLKPMLRDQSQIRASIALVLIRIGWVPESEKERIDLYLAYSPAPFPNSVSDEGVKYMLEMLEKKDCDSYLSDSIVKAIGMVEEERAAPLLIDALKRKNKAIQDIVHAALNKMSSSVIFKELENAYAKRDRQKISAIETALNEIDRPSLIKWKQ